MPKLKLNCVTSLDTRILLIWYLNGVLSRLFHLVKTVKCLLRKPFSAENAKLAWGCW